MKFQGQAKFLNAYIQKYENPETHEKSEYYKVTLFAPDSFDKSPNFSISEDAFKALKLEDEANQVKYRNADFCVFTVEIGSYNNRPTINIVEMSLPKSQSNKAVL